MMLILVTAETCNLKDTSKLIDTLEFMFEFKVNILFCSLAGVQEYVNTLTEAVQFDFQSHCLSLDHQRN